MLGVGKLRLQQLLYPLCALGIRILQAPVQLRERRWRAARRQPAVAEGEQRADAAPLARDWAGALLRKHQLASGGTVAYGRTGTAGPPEESERRERQAVVRRLEERWARPTLS